MLTTSSAIGQIIIELTYGKQIWDKHGAELLAINVEAVGIVASTFGKVWLVDIFPQCIIFSLVRQSLTSQQCALFPVGCLVQNSSMCTCSIRSIE